MYKDFNLTTRSTPKWTKEQKENIEAALQQALVDYGRYWDVFRQANSKLIKERLTESHKSRNALYDAIGDMDEYKFKID